MVQFVLGELRLGLVEISWDLPIMWANTLILFLVMKHFLFVPVTNFMKEREEEIKSQYDDAKNKEKEALSLKVQYEQKLQDSEEEGRNIVKEYRVHAEQRAEEIVKEAHQTAQTVKEKALQEVEVQKRRTVQELKENFSDLTIMAASKVLSREINDRDHDKLIDDFISEVGEVKWTN